MCDAGLFILVTGEVWSERIYVLRVLQTGVMRLSAEGSRDSTKMRTAENMRHRIYYEEEYNS